MARTCTLYFHRTTVSPIYIFNIRLWYIAQYLYRYTSRVYIYLTHILKILLAIKFSSFFLSFLDFCKT